MSFHWSCAKYLHATDLTGAGMGTYGGYFQSSEMGWVNRQVFAPLFKVGMGLVTPCDAKQIKAPQICTCCHMAFMPFLFMAWEVELTEECEDWWNMLSQAEQESVGHGFDLLAELGPALSRPHADTLKGSRYPNLKELRVQHEGRPYRVLYAFDPRRVALLLLGGDKTGDGRWYEKAIPQAETIYAKHLEELR